MVGRRAQGQGGSVSQPEEDTQWAYLFEQLRKVVDAIHELCEKKESDLWCKEASMTLQNYSHDFEMLIGYWNAETQWRQSDKPKAVAWEVRKTGGSPTKCKSIVTTDTLAYLPKPIILPSSPSFPHKLVSPGGNMDSSTSSQQNTEDSESGWSLVTRNRGSRHDKRTNYSNTMDANQSNYSNHNHSNRRLAPMFPRSAMEIPQTRASMAKMAYSRKWLWEKKEAGLRELMSQQQRAQAALSPRKAGSCPLIHQIGINFADPAAVRRSAHALKTRQQTRKMSAAYRNNRASLETASAGAHSLGSIKEEQPPADPAPTITLQVDTSTYPETDCRVNVNDVSTTTVVHQQDYSIPLLPLDLQSFDADLKNLTEEEVSLAQEEQSLQKEIEQEELLSIDKELERQVEEEAACAELLCVQTMDYDYTADRDAQTIECTTSNDVDTAHLSTSCEQRPMGWKDIVTKWLLTPEPPRKESWAEQVEREMATAQAHARPPGEAVQMHEKLSSPSRKRNPEDTVRRHAERQAKADDLRQQLMLDKAKRLKELSNRVEEVRSKRAAVVQRKKELLDTRMEKARDLREQKLQAVVRRAKEEEEKVHEIAFINALAADNKRFDALQRDKFDQERLKGIQAVRQQRILHKAQREAAVEERRRCNESEREVRLQEQAERTKRRQEEAACQRHEAGLDRQKKAREQDERLEEIKAWQQAKQDIKPGKQYTSHVMQFCMGGERQSYVDAVRAIKEHSLHTAAVPNNPASVTLGVVPNQSRPTTSLSMAQPDHSLAISHSVFDWALMPDTLPFPTPKCCSACSLMLHNALDVVVHCLDTVHQTHVMQSSVDSSKSDVLAGVTVCDADEDLIKQINEQQTNKLNQLLKATRKKRQKLRYKLNAKAKEFDVKSLLSGKTMETANLKSSTLQSMERVLKDLHRLVHDCRTQYNNEQNRLLDRSCNELLRLINSLDNMEDSVSDLLVSADLVSILVEFWTQYKNGIVNMKRMMTSLNILQSILDKETDTDNHLNICAVLVLTTNAHLGLIDELADTIKNVVSQSAVNMDGNNKKSKSVCVTEHESLSLALIQVLCSVVLCTSKAAQSTSNETLSAHGLNAVAIKSRLGMMATYVSVGSSPDALNACVQQVISALYSNDCTTVTQLCTVLCSTVSLYTVLAEHTDVSVDVLCTVTDSNLLAVLWQVLYVAVTQYGSVTALLQAHFIFATLLSASFKFTMLMAEKNANCFKKALSVDGLYRVQCQLMVIHSILTLHNTQHQPISDQAIQLLAHLLLAADQSQDEEMLVMGAQPTLLEVLCLLPWEYYVDKVKQDVLLPTLITACYNHTINTNILRYELHTRHLSMYLQSKLTASSDAVNGLEETSALDGIKHRLPSCNSQLVIDYFAQFP